MSDAKTKAKEAAIVQQALDRFKLAIEAEKAQRTRELDDLKFQVPELQWPDEVKTQRAPQMVNGVAIPGRPMLAIPKLDQPVQLVLNQEKAAHLGVQVHALTEDADDDTAEILQGLYRRIETDSRASLARSWAFERAVKAGRGAYRVLTEYDPAAPKGTHDQRIVIKRLLYQDAAYLDPFATEPDWSDGEWAFVTSWLQFSKYQRLYPDSQLASYDSDFLGDLATSCPEWVKGDGEGRAVLVAEYFCVEGEGDSRRVMWRKLNGVEILDEQPWLGRYIPIIPVIGRELIPFDAERRWTGIIGPSKDAQRLFNYAASTAVEMAALEPKAPYLLAEGQDEGYEAMWEQANVRNFPALKYRLVSLGGQPAPPPMRAQIDAGRLGPSMLLLQQADTFIHAGTGAFEPSLGQQSPNVRTKGATLALQQQHDQSNSHWLDNLAEISLTYEAKVVLDLIPQVYDRPGRVARILDLEDNPQTVMLNQRFVVDPQTKRPMPAPAMPPMGPQQPGSVLGLGAPDPEAKHYDLTKGRYGVSVSVGKAYKSRVEQGADELGQLFQAEPELFKILGDIYLKFRDFPGHQEAAERVKKMLPPPLQDQHAEQDAQRQLEQATAQLQQLQQALAEMQKALETDKVKADADIEKTRIATSAQIELQRMKDATALAVAKINALTKGVVADAAAEDEQIALAQQHAFDAHQAELDRQHQAAIARQAAAHQAEAAAQSHGQALEQGEQGQQFALDQLAAQPSPMGDDAGA